jgi:hypothetical protein
MIYVLDHPALDKTDLSSLELLLYGASAMSPSRLVEGIERIGPVFSQTGVRQGRQKGAESQLLGRPRADGGNGTPRLVPSS